jgi:hypothetical protein
MQPKLLLKQMVDFNKAAFDNSFNTMLILQEQMERMAKVYTDQATGISAEAKSAVNEWTKLYKKGLTDFKNMMDENFKKVESFLSPGA